MKKILIVIAALLLAALLLAGGFWGGMAYQTAKAEQARANFMNARGDANARGGTAAGQFPGGAQGFPGAGAPEGMAPGAFDARGTAGQVKSVEGQTLTLSTAQDVATVTLTDSTQIQKTVSGTVEDLQPGTRVMVAGDRDNDGEFTADRITILDGDAAPGGFASPPVGTEP